LIQNASDLDALRKNVIGWKPQNRILVHLTPKIVFRGKATLTEIVQKFTNHLTGFGDNRPMAMNYTENLLELSEEITDLLDHVVIEDYNLSEMIRAYVPVNGEVILGVY
jgi:hypothetical protein